MTGVEPAVRMLGRRIRSALSLVYPLSCSSHQAKQEQQVIEAHKTLRRFSVGDPVLYRDVLHKSWHRGKVKEVSDKQYVITRADGSVITKHIDHIRASTSPSPEVRGAEEVAGRHNERENVQSARPEHLNKPIVECEPNQSSDSISYRSQNEQADPTPSTSVSQELKSTPSVVNARPQRTSRPVERWGYTKLGG